MMKNRDDDRDMRVSLGDTDDMKGTSVGALRHLDELDDFEIADGEPDIRGWDVKGADGRTLGEVADLLVDTGAMKARYIEVKLAEDVAEEARRPGDDLNPRSEPLRHVLVPIGTARLDDENDEVLLGSRAAEIAGLPAYRRGKLSRDYESEVLRCYDSGPGGARGRGTESDFYSDHRFDDTSFFGTRRRGREGSSYFRRPAGASSSLRRGEREVHRRPVTEVEMTAMEGEARRGADGENVRRAR
jgi:hypothetical protein